MRAIVRSPSLPPPLSSMQRLRFEMLGLIGHQRQSPF